MNMLTREFIAHLVIWASHILFWVAMLPQVRLNYKLKSTGGLSDLMLIGYFNAYIAYMIYTFCLGLPLAYKVMVTLCWLTVIVMVFQRFYYGKRCKADKSLLRVYGANVLGACTFIPVAIKYPLTVGHAAGWVMVAIWAVYQIPQILKIYRSKSVWGYSFWLPSLIGIGDLIEGIAAIVLGLPLQTIMSDFRGFAVYLIFCVQFWLYSQE